MVLRAAGKLKVKYVLPGHGIPGGRELLTGQEQFMVELHKAVKRKASTRVGNSKICKPR